MGGRCENLGRVQSAKGCPIRAGSAGDPRPRACPCRPCFLPVLTAVTQQGPVGGRLSCPSAESLNKWMFRLGRPEAAATPLRRLFCRVHGRIPLSSSSLGQRERHHGQDAFRAGGFLEFASRLWLSCRPDQGRALHKPVHPRRIASRRNLPTLARCPRSSANSPQLTPLS